MTPAHTVAERGGTGRRGVLGTIGHTLRVIMRYPTGAFGLFLLALVVIVALIGPLISPYGPFDVVQTAQGRIARLVPPSSVALLGTTNQGNDVLSQLLYGTRVALMVGVISASGSVVPRDPRSGFDPEDTSVRVGGARGWRQRVADPVCAYCAERSTAELPLHGDRRAGRRDAGGGA